MFHLISTYFTSSFLSFLAKPMSFRPPAYSSSGPVKMVAEKSILQ